MDGPSSLRRNGLTFCAILALAAREATTGEAGAGLDGGEHAGTIRPAPRGSPYEFVLNPL